MAATAGQWHALMDCLLLYGRHRRPVARSNRLPTAVAPRPTCSAGRTCWAISGSTRCSARRSRQRATRSSRNSTPRPSSRAGSSQCSACSSQTGPTPTLDWRGPCTRSCECGGGGAVGGEGRRRKGGGGGGGGDTDDSRGCALQPAGGAPVQGGAQPHLAGLRHPATLQDQGCSDGRERAVPVRYRPEGGPPKSLVLLDRHPRSGTPPSSRSWPRSWPRGRPRCGLPSRITLPGTTRTSATSWRHSRAWLLQVGGGASDARAAGGPEAVDLGVPLQDC